VETSFQLLCGVIESDPAAFCRAAQAYFPVDAGLDTMDAIFDGIDRLLGQQNSQDRDAIIGLWRGACSVL
jgi:hypothetical protein